MYYVVVLKQKKHVFKTSVLNRAYFKNFSGLNKRRNSRKFGERIGSSNFTVFAKRQTGRHTE